MYTNFEDYERRINELISQIAELQNKLNQFQNLINEKDEQINQLFQENQQLKGQLQDIGMYTIQSPAYERPAAQSPIYEQESVQSPVYGQSNTQIPQYREQPSQSPSYGQQATQNIAPSPGKDINVIHKRECPKCGASGFAIKEVEDKSRLLSYVPRRIYAKKRVCTKCFYEW